MEIALTRIPKEEPLIQLYPGGVLESSPIGTSVGAISVVGLEQPYTVNKTADPDNMFTVDNNSLELKLAKLADYETKTSHSVTLSITKDGEVVATKTFSVFVVDANESGDPGL